MLVHDQREASKSRRPERAEHTSPGQRPGEHQPPRRGGSSTGGEDQEGDLERIDDFVRSTREAIFVRRADNVLFIRPDKTMGLNESAAVILDALYDRRRRPAREVLSELARRLGVDRRRLLRDTLALVDAAAALFSEDYSPRPGLKLGPFAGAVVRYPTLAEIALTYGCQNRCAFCYASSPHREGEHRLMTTGEVNVVMDKIYHQGKVPSLSFTGGEATLRPDLPELITYGRDLGFRVNLITNGLRAAEPGYARGLVDAGLASAQVSLEAADARTHDAVVGKPGAHARTVAGVRSFQQLGIHVHVNTTLCAQNLDAAPDLIRFAARDLGLRTMSMNMVIRTGEALRGQRAMEVSYTEIARRLPHLMEAAERAQIRLVWYSPLPYCIFNPVLHGLGAKSCACVNGILSVDPSGQVLPCSSFAEGIGSLLRGSYEGIMRGKAAQYWRKKTYIPPVCERCDDVDLCGGGCPLYWDAAGSFDEIPRAGAGDAGQRRRWERGRMRGGSYGVGVNDHGARI